jgi:hypothetical protein
LSGVSGAEVTTVNASDRTARDGCSRRIAPITSSPLRGETSARAGELGGDSSGTVASPLPTTVLRTTEHELTEVSSRSQQPRRHREPLDMTKRTDTAIIYL